MIIRKLFKFENAHIVRDCSSIKCSQSLHGHSYKVELLLESNFLDHGQMVYDFGLIKHSIKELVESFDHAVSLWREDDRAYIEAMQSFSERWLLLPVSPSAEQMSRLIFVWVDALLKQTQTQNGEKEVHLHSVIVHETDTGYAQCFKADAYSEAMGTIQLEDVVFSEAIRKSWNDPLMYEKLKNRELFINPKKV